jgi:hypothetical protein
MRDFRDAKAMAQTLRDALKARSISVTHSESLELVAKILLFHDWNVLPSLACGGRRGAGFRLLAKSATIDAGSGRILVIVEPIVSSAPVAQDSHNNNCFRLSTRQNNQQLTKYRISL